MTAITIIASLLAIGATVCAFIFVVPVKDRKAKIMQILHDLVNFKTLIIEKVLQATYILSTAFCITYGFFMLFYVESYGRYYSHWYGLEGLLTMILGPIAVRIAYEILLLAIIAVKNIIQINGKLKNQNEGEVADAFAMPKFEKTPKAAVAPQPGNNFCSNCGSKLDENGNCPNCK